MTVEEWALIACIVLTGMWSGLFGFLNLVVHRMLAAMDGRDFARFMRAFLPSRSPARSSFRTAWRSRITR